MLFITNTFFVFSAVGCALETAFALLVSGKLEIRKTTPYLPFCPVYGFGALMMYYTLTPFTDHPFVVLLLGAAVGTVAEYLYGFSALRLFHIYIWDYRRERRNLNGLITPFFTVMWGALSLVFIYVVAPVVMPLVANFPTGISLICLALLIAESVSTARMLQNIKKGADPNAYLCGVIKRA